ncbi:MAG: ABC transporter substrate-binding protein [Oscillospiraceae bacterium]|nr:ABC transporter substrate-binding protein [Oscillospiraceae bacterium]
MKKIMAILLSALMLFSLCACTTPTDNEKYLVGIVQLEQHAALDAATKGFRDALVEKLGDKVEFDEQNASGDSTNCPTIVNGFVSKNVDLIMANATPALQSAANITSTIPILGTSITEYGVALEIENFSGTVGRNISGTSDLAPLDEQAEMITTLLPDVKTVGILYCSSEANSLYQVQEVEKYLAAKNITTKRYAFSDGNDISAICTKAVSEVEAIYIPTDNKAASSTGIIDGVCRPAEIPIIAGEESTCKGCGVATLTIDYYDLGYATGLMAAKVLTGEANISEMPIEYAPKFTKKYNAEIANALGIEIPQDYIAIEK